MTSSQNGNSSSKPELAGLATGLCLIYSPPISSFCFSACFQEARGGSACVKQTSCRRARRPSFSSPTLISLVWLQASFPQGTRADLQPDKNLILMFLSPSSPSPVHQSPQLPEPVHPILVPPVGDGHAGWGLPTSPLPDGQSLPSCGLGLASFSSLQLPGCLLLPWHRVTQLHLCGTAFVLISTLLHREDRWGCRSRGDESASGWQESPWAAQSLHQTTKTRPEVMVALWRTT